MIAVFGASVTEKNGFADKLHKYFNHPKTLSYDMNCIAVKFSIYSKKLRCC